MQLWELQKILRSCLFVFVGFAITAVALLLMLVVIAFCFVAPAL